MSDPGEHALGLDTPVTVGGADTGLTLSDVLGPGAFLLAAGPEQASTFLNEVIDGLETETGQDLSHARPPTPPQEA